SNLQEPARLGVPWSGLAVLAGGDTGEGRRLAPPERGPDSSELLTHRAVVLFGVEGPVFADRKAEEEVEDPARRMAQLSISMNCPRGASPVILPNSTLEIREELLRARRLDLFELLRVRVRLPVQEIASPVPSIERHLVRAQDEARERVPRVAR